MVIPTNIQSLLVPLINLRDHPLCEQGGADRGKRPRQHHPCQLVLDNLKVMGMGDRGHAGGGGGEDPGRKLFLSPGVYELGAPTRNRSNKYI